MTERVHYNLRGPPWLVAPRVSLGAPVTCSNASIAPHKRRKRHHQQQQLQQRQQQQQQWLLRKVTSATGSSELTGRHCPYSLRGSRLCHCSSRRLGKTEDKPPGGAAAAAARNSSSSSTSSNSLRSRSDNITISSRSSSRSQRGSSNSSSSSSSSASKSSSSRRSHANTANSSSGSNSVDSTKHCSTAVIRRANSNNSSNGSSTSSRSASPTCPLCRGCSIFRHGSRLERREALLQLHGLGASGAPGSLSAAPAAADAMGDSAHALYKQKQQHRVACSSSTSSPLKQLPQQQRASEQRREIEALRRCLLSGLMRKERQRYRCPFCCWQENEAATAAAAAAASGGSTCSSSSCCFVPRRGMESQALKVQQQLQQLQVIDLESLDAEQQQLFFLKKEPSPRSSSSSSKSGSSTFDSSGTEALRVVCEGFDCRSLSSEAKWVVAELVKDGCFINTALQAVAAVQQQQQQQPTEQMQGRSQGREDSRRQQELAAARNAFAAACAAAAADMEAEAVSQQLLDLGALRAREEADSRRDREAQQQQQQLFSSAQPLWEQHGCLCSFLEAANPPLFEALTNSSSRRNGSSNKKCRDAAAAQGRVLLQRLFDLQQQLLRNYSSAAPPFICGADEEAWRLLRALRSDACDRKLLNIHDCLLLASAAAAAAAAAATAGGPAAAAAAAAPAARGRRARTKALPLLQHRDLEGSRDPQGPQESLELQGDWEQQQWPLSQQQQEALLLLRQQASVLSAAELQVALAKAYFENQEKALVESAFFSNLGSLAAPSLLLQQRQELLLLLGWWLRLSAFLSSTAAQLQQLLLLQQDTFENSRRQVKQQVGASVSPGQRCESQQQQVVSLADLMLRPHPTRGSSFVQLLLLHPRDSTAAAAVAAAAEEAGAQLESSPQSQQHTDKATATAAAPAVAAAMGAEEIASDVKGTSRNSENRSNSSSSTTPRKMQMKEVIDLCSSSSISPSSCSRSSCDEVQIDQCVSRPLRPRSTEETSKHLHAASRRRLRSSNSSDIKSSNYRSSGSASRSRLEAFAWCFPCSTAEHLAARLLSVSSDPFLFSSLDCCCCWDVRLPEHPGLRGLRAACKALLPWQLQQQPQQQQELCAYEVLSRLWRLTADPLAGQSCSPRVRQQEEQVEASGSPGGSQGASEESGCWTVGELPALVAAGLWLPALAFVGPKQQQQQQQQKPEQQQRLRDRTLWGRRQLVHLASQLLPQTSSAASSAHASPDKHPYSSNGSNSSSSCPSSKSTSSESGESLFVYRWLRGAIKAVEEATEIAFLSEAPNDANEELVIA
ncbi:hypothetical protein, conserved [Eimeria tenella]|uniref:Uncharacterized protein n=1 Tax=Eimeria tenella TaxID=5802 RepID=U6KU83_EIMTE|nr:hypothetical protein, conserved [Eimeria tenella]CDJ40468.1 hypothetical protein, conserved [Eimeria tenella]|eukprot:XP_013231218.1 hypothetical protein, conserved [Eimeria tenella]